MSDFQVVALPSDRFSSLIGADEEVLRSHGARRLVVDQFPGYPCRVSFTDASVGETVLLLSYAHHDVDSPYRASGPIFVREQGTTARPGRRDDADACAEVARRCGPTMPMHGWSVVRSSPAVSSSRSYARSLPMKRFNICTFTMHAPAAIWPRSSAVPRRRNMERREYAV